MVCQACQNPRGRFWCLNFIIILPTPEQATWKQLHRRNSFLTAFSEQCFIVLLFRHISIFRSLCCLLRKSHASLVMGDPVFNAFNSCYWPSNSSYKARESPVPENTSVYQVQDVDELYKFEGTVVQWLVLSPHSNKVVGCEFTNEAGAYSPLIAQRHTC